MSRAVRGWIRLHSRRRPPCTNHLLLLFTSFKGTSGAGEGEGDEHQPVQVHSELLEASAGEIPALDGKAQTRRAHCGL